MLPACQVYDSDRFPGVNFDGVVIPVQGGQGEQLWDWSDPAIRSRLQWLHLQQAMYPKDKEFWTAQIEEQERILAIYVTLSEIQTASSGRSFQLRAVDDYILEKLQHLRVLIGEEAYAAGYLIPSHPVHRYKDVTRYYR
jgi:hypothetical protein